MKRAYAKSQYAKPCERYCLEVYPNEAESIFESAEKHYLEFMKDMPDLGKNMMAANMLDWFTILAFYEASDRRMDGETLLAIKRRAVDKIKFLGKIIDGNRQKWPYRLFEKTYARFIKIQKAHQAKGEWMDSWKIEINPDHRAEGFCFHLSGCPIAKHAKAHGYEDLLPYLCKTDHYLAEVMHARLIRT
ncbi:MAG: L-2-amino-thiazoline-4-carboxylic acid hydrolase, partial [Clostridia bacterium]|nr:L-2-amino-thiazoline-4-carboxylic acid hydrolase [Clostridia bacterium]